jgi:hypothetical protein
MCRESSREIRGRDQELQEVFQKINSKPNLGRKTSHQNFGGTTTNLSVPEDISSPKIQREYKSLG